MVDGLMTIVDQSLVSYRWVLAPDPWYLIIVKKLAIPVIMIKLVHYDQCL